MRRAAGILLVFLFFIQLSGCQAPQACQDAIGCIRIPPGAPINIGLDKATTGDAVGPSQNALAALIYASQRAPLLGEHPYFIYFQESPCVAQTHLQAAAELSAQAQLAGILGPVCPVESAKFTKMISDGGQVLLSIGPLNDSSSQPGWFRIFPSLGVEAEAFEAVYFSQFHTRSLELVVMDLDIDRAFADRVCKRLQAHQNACSVVVSVETGVDAAQFSPLLEADPNGVVGVIAPFGQLDGFSGLGGVALKQDMVFFDPELAAMPSPQPAAVSGKYFITYASPKNADSLLAVLPVGEAKSIGMFAYDGFQILQKALAAVSRVEMDGTLVIPRQGLRDAISKISSYSGMMDDYTCRPGGDCANPENLLTLIRPDQKSNP